MEELEAKLEQVREAMHQKFNGHGAADRLAQLDSHMNTVKMIVEQIFDESTRMEGYTQ